jgi:hypothetical protein
MGKEAAEPSESSATGTQPDSSRSAELILASSARSATAGGRGDTRRGDETEGDKGPKRPALFAALGRVVLLL